MLDEIVPIFVILLRLLIPFTILRFPLLGGFLAMLSDTIDIMLFEAFGYGSFLGNFEYHFIDKIFDIWYLFFEFLVVLRWKDVLAKNVGKFLFGWRFIGFAVFMIFGFREAFFFAPNIFEYFFLLMLVIWKFNKKFKLDRKKLIIFLLVIGIPSLIKEYIMHFKQFGVWVWFRDNIFFWLYS